MVKYNFQIWHRRGPPKSPRVVPHNLLQKYTKKCQKIATCGSSVWQLFCMEDLCGGFFLWQFCVAVFFWLRGRSVWQFFFVAVLCGSFFVNLCGRFPRTGAEYAFGTLWYYFPDGAFGTAAPSAPHDASGWCGACGAAKKQNLPQTSLWQGFEIALQILKYNFWEFIDLRQHLCTLVGLLRCEAQTKKMSFETNT